MIMINRIIKRLKKEWKKTSLGRTKKDANPIRWGIIGLGYMAETFSCAIDGNKQGVVYAVASRSLDKAKSFSRNHGGCKAYGSYEEMINDESLNLDVIYVATPVKYHYEHVKLCLEAGKNVLCEKPITSNLEQFEELVDIAKAHNCFFMEGMWMKCLPSFQKACQWIADGRIGVPELIKVDFYKHELIRDGHAIFNAAEGGGVLRDFGVYAIAFMEHFLGGVPDEIVSYSHNSSYGIDSDWHITAQKGNIKAFVNLSSNFGSLSKAAVIGTQGFIEWDSQFNRTNRITLFDTSGIQVDAFAVNYEYDGFEYEVNEVQKCIREGKKESPVVASSGTLNTMTIITDLMQ